MTNIHQTIQRIGPTSQEFQCESFAFYETPTFSGCPIIFSFPIARTFRKLNGKCSLNLQRYEIINAENESQKCVSGNPSYELPPTGQENLQNNDFQKSSNVCNRLHKTNFMTLLGSFMIGLICGSDSEKITLRRSYEFEMHLVVESGNAFHLSVLQKN